MWEKIWATWVCCPLTSGVDWMLRDLGWDLGREHHPRPRPLHHQLSTPRSHWRNSGDGWALQHATKPSLLDRPLPPPPLPHAPNPSDGAAARRNSAAARILFVPPWPVLHTSAATAQLRPPTPKKRKVTDSKRSTPAAGIDKMVPKSVKTTVKAAATQRVQHPPHAQ
jgi:hypothetical protein